MLRGTRVGQAYIALTADGSGLNKDIVDAVDDAGDDISKKGDEHGDEYGEHFSEGFFSRLRGKFSDRLSSSIDSSALGNRAGDDAGDSFVERMTDKVRDLGDRLGGELSDRLASNPEQVRRGIDRAFDDDMMDRVGDRLGSRLVSGMTEAIDRQSGALSEAIESALGEAVSRNRGSRGKSDGMGDLVGRMLGAGSRNNVLNFFGKTMGNVVGLVEKGAMFAGTFATNMSKAGEGAGLIARFSAGFGGAGGGIAKFAASLPMLVISLGVVFGAMTLLVSVASALLGIVVALSSTIVSALVGALAVGAGAFAAIAAAAGLATIAFTSMTNSQRKYFFEVFEPIHAMFAGLGQIMLREMIPAFQSWSRNLQVALSLIKPLAEVMGGAFARAGDILTASLSGPGIRMFITTLSQTLPGIVTNLSSAFGGFLNGVSGIFAALMPFVLRFSDYLSRVASDFSRWATSARGQNSIVDFVDRALVSLSSLWNFVTAVGGLLSALLFNPKGQRVGNSIFDSMADSIRDFTDYISTENRLEEWFKNARKFARLLGKAIEGIGDVLTDLDNSAAIDALWDMAKALETAFKWARKAREGIEWIEERLGSILPPGLNFLGVMQDTAAAAEMTRDAVAAWKVPDGMIAGAEALNQLLLGPLNGGNGVMGPFINPNLPDVGASGNNSAIQDLINSGTDPLNNTYEQYGGHMPDPTDADKGPKFTQFEGGPVKDDKEWKNPWIAFANSILAQAPTLADEIREAFRVARGEIATALADSGALFSTLSVDLNASFVGTINEAVKSTDFMSIADSIGSMIDQTIGSVNSAIEQANSGAASVVANASATRDQMVASAQSAVDAAAQRLASATTNKEAKAAMRELDRAQYDLDQARRKGDDLVAEANAAAAQMIANAGAAGAGVERANAILEAQAVYTFENALNLARGLQVQNATLADYAEARRWAGERLAEANEKLAAAISLRDTYGTQIADSVRSFGSLLTASAKSLDGVEQALTAGDITDNLRDRLTKIKTFQENLRLLLANGISDAAYKQIVDAGVDGGSAYAEALVKGGAGSISEVNSLVNQIDKAATGLGGAAASQLYQAGVDAAQGLVDGLLSLSQQLDSAAAQLGASIAAAIKRELGIASPSRVLMSMMDNVGDGAVLGLDAQHSKVGAAAARFSDQIAVSPEVAAYASQQAARAVSDEVSGNSGSDTPKFLWTGDIVTPTEDPEAVTTEVLNELTGRLT